jgi:hypothetical protein
VAENVLVRGAIGRVGELNHIGLRFKAYSKGSQDPVSALVCIKCMRSEVVHQTTGDFLTQHVRMGRSFKATIGTFCPDCIEGLLKQQQLF